MQETKEQLKRNDIILNFVVEEGNANEGAPAEILSQIKKKNISGISDRLGWAIPERKEIPGLQAADGLANVAWHKEQDQENKVFRLDPSAHYDVMTDGLIKQERMPVYFCHINQRELTEFVGGYFAHVEHRRNYWKQKHKKVS